MNSRREFLKKVGLSAAVLPMCSWLPSLSLARSASTNAGKQRLVIMFSPNGTVPEKFWPDEQGADFKLKEICNPLEAYRDKMLFLKGISNRVRGDGDSHMRGMSCLLTGIELFPGNVQGGSDTPAGWASGISIDQELKNFLQSKPETQTRFGSLELGVTVPNRADPWTRMVYGGPNQPIAPIDDPYQLFAKMYGKIEDEENLRSVLDDIQEDLKRVSQKLSAEDRKLLDANAQFVREMEANLQRANQEVAKLSPPTLTANIRNQNESMPDLSRMQIELLVNSFQTDMTRIATLQYTNSVGQAKMSWLGIDENHHTLSHDPDLNAESQTKLTKINVWFCEQLKLLVEKLANTPEPGGEGSMLDHTTVIWTNELGKGNSHTLENIPFLLVGGGMGFKMGRSLQFDKEPHNRLWLAIAHAFGHTVPTFGKPELCEKGVLHDLS